MSKAKLTTATIYISKAGEYVPVVVPISALGGHGPSGAAAAERAAIEALVAGDEGLKEVKFHYDKKGLQASNADFRRIEAPYVDFSGSDLHGSDFRSASLLGANFDGCNLEHASFFEANITWTNFSSARLIGASFDGAFFQPWKREDAKHYIRELVARAIRSDGYEFFGWLMQDGETWVKAGCRLFSLDEFRKHVAEKQYPDYPGKANETLDILDHIALRAHRRKEALREAANEKAALVG